MHKVIRGALLIGAIYCAGTYYFDRPEEVKEDVAALRDMTARLPEPEQVMANAEATGEYAEKTVFRAKQRLDSVRTKVQTSIETGAERFAGAD